jgi:hypothetical protein
LGLHYQGVCVTCWWGFRLLFLKGVNEVGMVIEDWFTCMVVLLPRLLLKYMVMSGWLHEASLNKQK